MNDSKKAAIKKDFLEFSGGFTPDETDDEAIKYMMQGEFHQPDLTEEELVVFFTEWVQELNAQKFN